MLGQKRDKDHKEKIVVARPKFDRGDRVTVRDGVFAGMEGEVKDVLEAKGMVRVELTVRSKSLKSEETGVVRWAVEVFNQKDELVATYDLLTENVP